MLYRRRILFLQREKEKEEEKEKDQGNPLKGRRFFIYGSYKRKEDAEEKHKKVAGSWILEREVKGKKRFVVLSERK